MPATRPKPLFRWPSASSRQALAATLRVTETGVAVLRRDADRVLGRAQLRVRAWREALDPTTATWVADARRTPPAGDAEKVRADLQRRIEEAGRGR